MKTIHLSIGKEVVLKAKDNRENRHIIKRLFSDVEHTLTTLESTNLEQMYYGIERN